MLRNYLTMFVRILMRQKIYSAINVFGLALGVAATLLITLYISEELSYDTFHKDADRIYRIGWLTKFSGVERRGWKIGAPTGLALQRDVAQIESVLRMELWNNTIPVRYEDQLFMEKQLLLADSNFFDFFNFKLLIGNSKEVLRGPNKIVLTESLAKKYFNYKGKGDSSPLGKTLLIDDNKVPMVVSGIAADPPVNSHLHFKLVASTELMPIYRQLENGWWGIRTYTYFKLADKGHIESVEAYFPNYYKILLENAKREGWSLGETWEQAHKNGNSVEYFVQPLLEIHLGGNLQYEFEPNGEKIYLYLLSYVALFIILLACINFLNLTTARAANRAKEIGIRKTIGALKGKLIGQFLVESFLYTALSIVLALAICSVCITPFNILTGKSLSIDQFYSLQYIGLLTFFCAAISLLTGIYPAFYLSSFRPVEVLKGRLTSGTGNFSLRNSLVVFQFVISTTLIITTLIVYQQIQFLKKSDTGFDRENVVVLSNGLSLEKNSNAFKNELTTHSEIISASFSNRVPPNIENISGFQKKGENSFHWIYRYQADYDHAKTIGYQIKEGRYFSRDFPSDSTAIVINEAAADIFGISDLKHKQYIGFPPNWYPEVIGIVRDFNFETLRNKVGPVIILRGGQSKVSIRITPGNVSEKLALIKTIWSKYSPAPFEYTFLNENMEKLYQEEEQFGKITFAFTSLAIIIACLGLLGLVTYMASQRTKEIGIRKVMGATVHQIVVLLSKDFVKLILIALVIAIPVSWYCMNEWLNTFAYRIDFNLMIAICAGVAVLLIALLTVSYQSIKAAMGNPVESLRSE